jgi:hypothetical protein
MKKDGAVEVRLREKFFSKSNRIWQSINIGLENGSLTKAPKIIEDDLFRLERLLEGGAQLSGTGAQSSSFSAPITGASLPIQSHQQRTLIWF